MRDPATMRIAADWIVLVGSAKIGQIMGAADRRLANGGFITSGECIMRAKMLLTLLAVSMLVPATAWAKNQGKIPADAKPMAVDDIKKLFLGRSVDFKIAAYYFDPNGQVIGVAGKNDGFADGKWSTDGNEFCMSTDWKGQDKAKPPFHYEKCQKFYMSKNVIYAENTKVEDQWLEDKFQWAKGDGTKFKDGDLISARYKAAKVKFGY